MSLQAALTGEEEFSYQGSQIVHVGVLVPLLVYHYGYLVYFSQFFFGNHDGHVVCAKLKAQPDHNL